MFIIIDMCIWGVCEWKITEVFQFPACIYHCNLHQRHAVNCFRNSRLAVDDDDVKWVKNKKKVLLLLKHFHDNNCLKLSLCVGSFRDAKWYIGASWGFNPLTAKLFNLNFHPLKVVSRWRDPQLQVNENYSDLTKWRSSVFKYCWLMSHFIFKMFKRWYLMC